MVYRFGSISYLTASSYGIIRLLWSPIIKPKPLSSSSSFNNIHHDNDVAGNCCHKICHTNIEPITKSVQGWLLVKIQFILASSHFILGGVLLQASMLEACGWVWLIGSIFCITGSLTSLWILVYVDKI
jgi:hypothetical protein